MERDDKAWRQPTDAAVTRVTAEIREVSGDEDLVARERTSWGSAVRRPMRLMAFMLLQGCGWGGRGPESPAGCP
jgi:hypothetical protein